MQYEKRYADKWKEISLRTRQMTGFKCCFPGCHKKATETHHALYRDKDGPIAGREIPLVHCFGLCEYHHSDKDKNCAHAPVNWFRGHELGARLDARLLRVNYFDRWRQLQLSGLSSCRLVYVNYKRCDQTFI